MTRKPNTNAAKTGKSRKELRKDAKKFKKLRNIAFASKKPIEAVIAKTIGDPSLLKKKKKTKSERKKAQQEKLARGEEIVHQPTAKDKKKQRKHLDDNEEYEKLKKDMERTRREREKELAKLDEKEIKLYAKQLGYKNTNNIPAGFVTDGLDYVLEMCDRAKREEEAEKEIKQAEKDTYQVKKKEKASKKSLNCVEDDEEEDEDSGDGGSMEGSELDELEQTMAADEQSDEELEFSDEEEEMDDEDEDEDDEEDDVSAKVSKDKTVGEDIYGRTIDRRTGQLLIEQNPAGARKKLEELEEKTGGDEERKKIEKTIQGLFNRLVEGTLVKSAKDFDQLYKEQSKNEVKRALTRIFHRFLCQPFRLPDQVLACYGVFIALLHATVSSEITSFLVEEFMVEFVGILPNLPEDKSAENRAIFAAHLLNFKIIRGDMIIELLNKMKEHLGPSTLSLSIHLINYCYKALRRTVNTALIEFITTTQTALQAEEYQAQSRMRFLSDELSLIRKNQGIEQPEVEHLLSVYHGLVKKRTDVEKELGMSLEDLLLADERGRWWVVGSAFKLSEGEAVDKNKLNKKNITFDANILELAKKAGMNTEVRRNVFCSIVSARGEDDAFERLMRLSLKGAQEREIIHIILTMQLKEKTFNPFYATLIQRFASYHKRFALTAQYATWDRLREIDKLKPFQRSHLADFLYEMFRKRTLPLTILKVVEWGDLSPATSDLLQHVFDKLAGLGFQKVAPLFSCLLDGKNRVLTEAVRLFLQMRCTECQTLSDIENLFATSR